MRVQLSTEFKRISHKNTSTISFAFFLNPFTYIMSLDPTVSAFFRQEILAMSAYHVTDATGLIKLDAMENPYGWPENIKTAWLQALKDCPLNRYPDPDARQLAESIRQLNKIPDHLGLLLGNGSDEIILLLLMALVPGSGVLAPEPSFVMYKQLSLSLGLNYLPVPLLSNSFDLDLQSMLSVIQQHQPALLFLAYPNNPTANLFNDQSIREVIKASHGLVVIDEAYAPFAGASYMDKLEEFDNVLIMRTVSKLGLAGLRLGYLAGDQSVIGELNKIRLPYNINALTQISACFALSNKALFDEQTEKICSDRAALFFELEQLDDIVPFPSAANFILFKTPENQATNIFEMIKQQGVLIKNVSPQGGLLKDCLRVTIGKPDENDAFLRALKSSLAALKK
jgi:histidinol-phosphate aminotransferase